MTEEVGKARKAFISMKRTFLWTSVNDHEVRHAASAGVAAVQPVAGLSPLLTLCGEHVKGAGMPDPVTFSALGGWAALEGIKFLYGQAAEVLKAWRDRRGQAPSAPLVVPIMTSDVLDGTPAEPVVDAAVLDRENASLASLLGRLAPYAQELADLDPDDAELAEQAGRVRAVLEAAYGQRFTFRGEQRDPTGTQVSVTQVLGQVAGTVLGAEADVGSGAGVDVHQQVRTVESGGSVTGFKGSVGG